MNYFMLSQPNPLIAETISGSMEYLMWPIVILMVLVMAMKMIKGKLKGRKKNKKVPKPLDENDRLYIALKKGCSMSKIMKRTPVRVTGDEATPSSIVGETCTGVLPKNEEIVMFIKKKWWMFWKEPFCLRVEPELMGDMNVNEITIYGRGVEPSTERYAHVIPPNEFYDQVSREKLAQRRSEVMSAMYKRMLDVDINQDCSIAVKHSIRPSEKLTFRELYTPTGVMMEDEERLERERKRKTEEMQGEYEKSSQPSPFPQQQDDNLIKNRELL